MYTTVDDEDDDDDDDDGGAVVRLGVELLQLGSIPSRAHTRRARQLGFCSRGAAAARPRLRCSTVASLVYGAARRRCLCT